MRFITRHTADETMDNVCSTNLRLPKNLLEDLRQLAQKEERSINQTILRAIRIYVSERR